MSLNTSMFREICYKVHLYTRNDTAGYNHNNIISVTAHVQCYVYASEKMTFNSSNIDSFMRIKYIFNDVHRGDTMTVINDVISKLNIYIIK
jgi:hypothetical protein